MKKVLFLVILIASASSANCQKLIFKTNQFATSSIDSKTGMRKDAEVNDIPFTISLSNTEVLIEGPTSKKFTLNKAGSQTKANNNIVSYSYRGIDEKDASISFVYTINLTSKEAVVETEQNKVKNYYFGIFSSSDLTLH
jgi:hypothetical protein